MKILFMGTPDFAVGSLRALVEAGHELVAVVTQPDKAKGRSDKLIPTPVKEAALEYNIPVLQPVKIKTPEAVAMLRDYPADVYVVAAFGQILSREILDMPRYGCLCVHGSLLPKYRGASPMQHAIIQGETMTGITIMQMDAGVDTGDMLYKKEVEITNEDNYETLHDKMMAAGGKAITEALALLEQGKLHPEKQKDEESNYAPLIKKEMGRIDFSKSAVELDRLIRGLTPWPSAFTGYKGKQLKLWRAYPMEEHPGGRKPGEIIEVTRDSVSVQCGEGSLRITELQLEGKKRMSARDFLLGVKMCVGEYLEMTGGK